MLECLMAYINETVDAFLDCTEPEPNSGCWLWIRGRMGTGYGETWDGQKVLRANRVAWQLFRGPIPPGMCVLHRCDVRSCVNPAHLFLGTIKDNALDASRKGRLLRKICKHGHPFTETSTKVYRGVRFCLICRRHRSLEWYYRVGRPRKLKQIPHP